MASCLDNPFDAPFLNIESLIRKKNVVVINASIGSSFFDVLSFTLIGLTIAATPTISSMLTIELPITFAIVISTFPVLMLLKDIASEIGKNHPEINLLILLIDERPEEVTDIRSCVEHAEIVCSTFDEGAEHHVRSAELTIEHARRMVEQGKHVVLLLDSLTKLTRAYNALCDNTGKTLSGGLDVGALAEPKRFFGAARNTVEGGSLTILATVLVDTGSRMDDVIYEEFKGTGNSDIFLSRELAERRIFPAIDIRRSGTRKEELLLDREELSAVYALRERGLCENTVGMLDTLKKTKNNEEFVVRLPEWLKTYKNM